MSTSKRGRAHRAAIYRRKAVRHNIGPEFDESIALAELSHSELDQGATGV